MIKGLLYFYDGWRLLWSEWMARRVDGWMEYGDGAFIYPEMDVVG